MVKKNDCSTSGLKQINPKCNVSTFFTTFKWHTHTRTSTHNIHDNFEYFTGFWRFITKPHIINEFHFLDNIFGIKQSLLALLKLDSRLSPCASIKISLRKLKMNPKKYTHRTYIYVLIRSFLIRTADAILLAFATYVCVYNIHTRAVHISC